MKRNSIILLLLLLVTFVSTAQNQSEYIRKGDEAMKAMNYSLAKMYYDEVIIAACDMHSIKQLTTIWLNDESMRADMNSIMRRCFSCLDDEAKKLQDTASIQLLVTYYTKGIGTNKNEEMSAYWNQRLEEIRNPSITMIRQNGGNPPRKERKMDFFVGYHASLIAPLGIQVGGMGKSAGWYVRFRSTFSFQATKTEYDCEVKNKHLIIKPFDNDSLYYGATGKNKVNCLMGSAGMIFKAADNLFVSAGIGYCDRQYAREYVMRDDNGIDKPATSGWARDTKSSMNGVSIELDGMYVISGKFYGSLGASIMNFKYMYPSMGVGIVF